MKLLITGANGQLGWELSRSIAPLGEVIALDRAHCDLSNPQGLAPVLDEARPDVIVNAAAYTAVDDAEDHEALATIVNGEAVGALAEWARQHRALMIHYSTDYVFDGGGSRPYTEHDTPAPVSAYGRSKLAGERALAQADPKHLCLRTSWVYATRGRNFLLTMLKLGKELQRLRVVSDQIGAPTWARDIADATGTLIGRAQQRLTDGVFESGLFHMTAAGQTSWHGFAEAIFSAARARGVALCVEEVEPIPSSAYPTKATRPLNSRLSNEALRDEWGVELPPWEKSLERAMDGLTR